MRIAVVCLFVFLPMVFGGEPLPEWEYFTVRDRMLKHSNSGRCLSLDSAYQHTGNKIYLYECKYWKGYDTYKLVNYKENEWYIKFLWGPTHYSTESWTCVKDESKSYVHSQTCSYDWPSIGDYAHQRWSFINTGDFRWLIRNVWSGKCMRPVGHWDYAQVDLVTCNENDKEQHWFICNRDENPYCNNMQQVTYASQALCCGIHDHSQDAGFFNLLSKQCEERLKEDPTYCNAENIKPVINHL